MNRPLVRVEGLKKLYSLGKIVLPAVQNISFSLAKGETLGLGGESGSGKSTLAKLIMGLVQPSAGSVWIDGKNLRSLSSQHSQTWRAKVQMVFQHPAASLDPCMTISEILQEPLTIHRLANGKERAPRLIELMSQVGLSEHHLCDRPFQLSGGQKQRVAIARALALRPQVLICDEPFSALDQIVQTQIVHVLMRLQEEQHLAYLIISHDLLVLRYMTQKLAIMYAGQFVEWGPSDEVYKNPIHPYTKKLVSAILPLKPLPTKKHKLAVQPMMPEEERSSLGCCFYQNCPVKQSICQQVKPEWRQVEADHYTACHFS
jgi:peptide/nickel transport system ATP-binding protein/oligopeptide transport system ATP-binding protein